MPDLRDGMNPPKFVEYPKRREVDNDPTSLPPWERPLGKPQNEVNPPPVRYPNLRVPEEDMVINPNSYEEMEVPEGRGSAVLLPTDPWQHRSVHMRCRSCMWYAEKVPSFGRCRRHAPTMSGYPAVYSTDWCGDHKMNEEKL